MQKPARDKIVPWQTGEPSALFPWYTLIARNATTAFWASEMCKAQSAWRDIFFDGMDGLNLRNDEGMELPDLTAARAHAIRRETDFVSLLDGNGCGGYVIVKVRDSAEKLVRLRLVCQLEAV